MSVFSIFESMIFQLKCMNIFVFFSVFVNIVNYFFEYFNSSRSFKLLFMARLKKIVLAMLCSERSIFNLAKSHIFVSFYPSEKIFHKSS